MFTRGENTTAVMIDEMRGQEKVDEYTFYAGRLDVFLSEN